MEPDWLRFGILRRPHGIKGEIVLAAFNPHGARLEAQGEPLPVRLLGAGTGQGEAIEARLVACRRVAMGFLARFEGWDTRERVAQLVGRELHVPRARLSPLAVQEFYVEDLPGCEVFALDGRSLGRVAGTFWNGAQDVMVIRGQDGDERLLSVVAQFVHSFEPALRRLTVDPHD